jgi:membrane-bound ClpP family serine protease
MIWVLPSVKANRKQRVDQNTNILQSVGEVAEVIPPHRTGCGKIHLNFRTGPYELEAITAGDELPAGSSIKVVDIIDERIVLVERVTNSQRNVEGLDDRPPGTIGPQQ